MKLVLEEAESTALERVVEQGVLFTSALATVEVPRALSRRATEEPSARGWDELRSDLRVVALEVQVLSRAAALAPAALRSPDAIHLASALSIAAAIDGVLVYDRRLAEACASHGLTVASPGA